MADAASEEEEVEEEEGADITKAISRMAHSMRARRVCGQSAIARSGRPFRFGEKLRELLLPRGSHF